MVTAERTQGTEIMFTEDDLELFAQASFDRNPLHLDEGYARKTPYGEKVVYGILGIIACLGRLDIEPGYAVAQMQAEFLKPLFCHIVYQVRVQYDIAKNSAAAIIMDGKRKLLKLTVKYRQSADIDITWENLSNEPNAEARLVQASDVKTGQVWESSYCPSPIHVEKILNRFGLDADNSTRFLMAALLWSSYSIGMEFPGRQALFAKIGITVNDLPECVRLPFSCKLAVTEFDDRFNQLAMRFNCQGAADQVLCFGELTAYIRSELAVAADMSFPQDAAFSRELQGKTALILGGSRGLGAIIARIFALQGCTVIINYKYSVTEALALQQAIKAEGGNAMLWQGDAGDIAWLMEQKEQLLSTLGRLDILVCNACPSPKMTTPLPAEPETVYRINQYLQQAFALTSVPLAVFADLLNESKGWGITISSEYITHPPAEFPHYVSAKAAVEALTQSVAARFKQAKWLIVRPPKLLTDMTNTPTGNYDATNPQLVGWCICRRIITGQDTTVEVLDRFD